MKMSELQTLGIEIRAPKTFRDPFGKTRLIALRYDPKRMLAFQVDLVNREYRWQPICAPEGTTFGPWQPVSPETVYDAVFGACA
jgi:hypothetical protein